MIIQFPLVDGYSTYHSINIFCLCNGWVPFFIHLKLAAHFGDGYTYMNYRISIQGRDVRSVETTKISCKNGGAICQKYIEI